MPTFSEVLPSRKASRHSGLNFTPAEDDGPVAGELLIFTDRCTARYAVTEFPTDWNGRGFHLAKLAAVATGEPAETYCVFCARNGRDRMCDCKGFSFAGHCKHVDAVSALIENGWL